MQAGGGPAKRDRRSLGSRVNDGELSIQISFQLENPPV